MKVMYIYRAEMRKNGKEEPNTVYLYARNKKAAKEFCKQHFDKFDNFVAIKFGTTQTAPPGVNASFINEGDEEMKLIRANIAGNGEVYAERFDEGE